MDEGREQGAGRVDTRENAAAAGLRVAGAERPDGLELRTAGLADHGLPELRVTGLPPYLGQGWARVLAAVAQRLVRETRSSRPQFPGESAPLPGESSPLPGEVVLDHGVTVALRSGDEPGTLVPGPPRAHEGPLGEWQRDVLLRLFPAARS